MDYSNIVFKGDIWNVNNKVECKIVIEIFYKIIILENKFAYAVEISTGAIFPTASSVAWTANNDHEGKFKFFTSSNLRYGNFFVPVMLKVRDNNDFEYELNFERQKEYKSIPTEEEIKAYLRKKKFDIRFKKNIREMEQSNTFMCNTNSIRNRIKKVLTKEIENGNLLAFEIQKNNEQYLLDSYQPRLNLSSINTYGYDLSTSDNLCNIIGRDSEIKKIIKAICIKGKSVILIGESGSGKTAVAKKLALEIKRQSNEWLNGKTIFYLNTLSLVSGTTYRGMFEENLKKIIDFCKANRGKIILFVDEMHTLCNLGNGIERGMDAINILKPYIGNGDIIMIGATTKNEYEEYLVPDSAFLRRFDKIEISTPTKELNQQIMLSFLRNLESKYQITFPYSEDITSFIINSILDITDPIHQNLIGDAKINNPSLAKSVLEDSFIEAFYNKKSIVNIDDVYLALIECDNLSPTIRKEGALKLKNFILTKTNINPPPKKKVLSFPQQKINV